MQITKPKELSKKAKSHEVTRITDRTFQVKSSSGRQYTVRPLRNMHGATCDCKWGQYRSYRSGYQSGCSHVQAVMSWIEGQRKRTISAWGNLEDAQRQHRQMVDIRDGVILTIRKVERTDAR